MVEWEVHMPRKEIEEALHAAGEIQVRSARGSVEVGWTKIPYELYGLDARAGHDRDPKGNIIVILPGHGQTAAYPKRMATAAAIWSKSKIVWSIDVTPPAGGDPIKAKAVVRIVEQEIEKLYPGIERSPAVTLIGWSHGGAEALRAALEAPDLFPHVVGLCPAGMLDRGFLNLLLGFTLEVARILWAGLRVLDWGYIQDLLGAGVDLLTGLGRDLFRSRSPRRLVTDIHWASRKVPGGTYDYPGEVIIFFGAQDTVIRWQDVFPECSRPDEIDAALDNYRQRDFPRVGRLEVRVIEGNHFAPETEAFEFIRPALETTGQIDRSRSESALQSGAGV
jgi:pimeloyl-ACP methyl ester carboxylesterase